MLTGVSVIFPEPLAVTPVMVPLTDEVQLKVVPPMEEVGKKFKAVPLQIDCIRLEGVLVMTGFGVTLTVTEMIDPLQPLALGVISYVIVPELIPSVAVSVWLITEPDPADAPEILVALDIVHE